jgi:hypothetical protein
LFDPCPQRLDVRHGRAHRSTDRALRTGLS